MLFRLHCLWRNLGHRRLRSGLERAGDDVVLAGEHGLQALLGDMSGIAIDDVKRTRPCPRATIAGSRRYARCTVPFTLVLMTLKMSSRSWPRNPWPSPTPALSAMASGVRRSLPLDAPVTRASCLDREVCDSAMEEARRGETGAGAK